MSRLHAAIVGTTLAVFAVGCSDDSSTPRTTDSGGTQKDSGVVTVDKGGTANCGMSAPVSSEVTDFNAASLCETECVIGFDCGGGFNPRGKYMFSFSFKGNSVNSDVIFEVMRSDQQDAIVKVTSGGDTSTPAQSGKAGSILESRMGGGTRKCDADTSKCTLVSSVPVGQDVTVTTKKYEVTFKMTMSSVAKKGTVEVSSFKKL